MLTNETNTDVHGIDLHANTPLPCKNTRTQTQTQTQAQAQAQAHRRTGGQAHRRTGTQTQTHTSHLFTLCLGKLLLAHHVSEELVEQHGNDDVEQQDVAA